MLLLLIAHQYLIILLSNHRIEGMHVDEHFLPDTLYRLLLSRKVMCVLSICHHQEALFATIGKECVIAVGSVDAFGTVECYTFAIKFSDQTKYIPIALDSHLLGFGLQQRG